MKKLLITLGLFSIVAVGCSNNQKLYTRQEVTSPTQAIKLLKDGNQRYIQNQNLKQDLSQDKKNQLKSGQNPFVTILSCSDSRVVSPYIFDQGLGDIFEVKLAGNVVDETALGSIKYGIENLKTPLVVILAHESCGAVYATVDVLNNKLVLNKNSAINSIVNKIAPSYKQLDIKNTSTLSDIEIKELLSVENAKLMKTELLKNEQIKTKYDNKEIEIVIAKYMLSGEIVWSE